MPMHVYLSSIFLDWLRVVFDLNQLLAWNDLSLPFSVDTQSLLGVISSSHLVYRNRSIFYPAERRILTLFNTYAVDLFYSSRFPDISISPRLIKSVVYIIYYFSFRRFRLCVYSLSIFILYDLYWHYTYTIFVVILL